MRPSTSYDTGRVWAVVIGSILVLLTLSFLADKAHGQTAITIIQSNNWVSDSRAIINSNFVSLRDNKPDIYRGTYTPSGGVVGDLFVDTSGTAGVNVYYKCTASTWCRFKVDLADLMTTVTVPYGGTGATTLSGVLKGNGTSAIGSAAFGDVVALFGSGSCVGYLANDGTCSTPLAGGYVQGAANLTTAGRLVKVSAANTVTEDSALTVSGGVITATGFSGPLTGNVTGDVSGNASTVTNISSHASTELSDSASLVRGGANLTTADRLMKVSAAGTATEDSALTVSGGVITATGFSGPLSGNATSATTATTASSATTATTAANVAGGVVGNLVYQTAVDTTGFVTTNVSATRKYLQQYGDGVDVLSTAWESDFLATDLTAHDPAVLAGESLTNGDLTGGTDWTAADDFSLVSDYGLYTYSSGSGTLTQASGTLAIAGLPGHYYQFEYTISNRTGIPPTCVITTSFADASTNLGMGAGSHTVFFTAAASPGDFVISCTVAGVSSFRIDSLSLKEVQGGDVIAGGYVSANLYGWSVGPDIASDTTIAPTHGVHHITGTNAVATITVPSHFPSPGGCIKLIPDGLFTTTNADNIALATTAVVGRMLELCYDYNTSKWYPSY